MLIKWIPKFYIEYQAQKMKNMNVQMVISTTRNWANFLIFRYVIWYITKPSSIQNALWTFKFRTQGISNVSTKATQKGPLVLRTIYIIVTVRLLEMADLRLRYLTRNTITLFKSYLVWRYSYLLCDELFNEAPRMFEWYNQISIASFVFISVGA